MRVTVQVIGGDSTTVNVCCSTNLPEHPPDAGHRAVQGLQNSVPEQCMQMSGSEPLLQQRKT